MNRPFHWPKRLLAVAILVMLGAGHPLAYASKGEGAPEMKAHYIEIVTAAVDKQCKALVQVHGLSFGPEVQDLGGARVAEKADGSLIGVRAPMAAHEQPIMRAYFEVDDIEKAVKDAEAAGAVIAYPPTKQGETGTWAIYILDGIQHGLWQR